MNPMQFARAERKQVKLKIGVQGPSGSGKTYGALALARGLVGPAGRIAMIDTENRSGSLYAADFEFDTLELSAPYTVDRYLEAMHLAVREGYDIVIVDSLSHEWAGADGILDKKETADARGGNSYTNWGAATKEHNRFVAALLALPVHVIGTMRSKQEYVLETDARGKQVPKKMGMAAIQRDGLDYEFSVVYEVGIDHIARGVKDRTKLFAGRELNLCSPVVAEELKGWMTSGKADVPAPEVALPTPEDMRLPFKNSAHYGKRLGDLPTDFLEHLSDWIISQRYSRKDDTLYDELLRAVTAVTTGRELNDNGAGDECDDPDGVDRHLSDMAMPEDDGPVQDRTLVTRQSVSAAGIPVTEYIQPEPSVGPKRFPPSPDTPPPDSREGRISHVRFLLTNPVFPDWEVAQIKAQLVNNIKDYALKQLLVKMEARVAEWEKNSSVESQIAAVAPREPAADGTLPGMAPVASRKRDAVAGGL